MCKLFQIGVRAFVLFMLCYNQVLLADDVIASENDVAIAKTRSIMDQIFSSLTNVLPLSFDRVEYANPANRDKIATDLKKLNDSTTALVSHVQKFDGSYGFIATSMAHDIKDVYSWYQKGSYSESAYLLQQITENCTSCHMKLPDPGHAPHLDQFFKNVSIAKLDPPERARLQVALRQIDAALQTWEEWFASSSKPAELLVMDAMTEYLKVAIRVKSDPNRALKKVVELSKRKSLPHFLIRETAAWVKSLTKLKSELTKTGNEIKRASKIILSAQKTMEFPMDRSGLIDYMVASSLLNRRINDGKTTAQERAEAYYYLGLTEMLIGRNVWITQVDYYFEAAIRAAPRTKYAMLALDGLEQQVMMEYSGSGGFDIPDDIRIKLEQLRALR